MDQNFQTSFIPKKPIVKDTAVVKQPVGLLTIISVLFFIAMVVTAGGLYFYKKSLTDTIDKKASELLLARGRLEETQIPRLKILDKRLRASSDILSKHIAVTPIFKALQSLTLSENPRPKVRFTKFSYELSKEKTNKIAVKLSGTTTGYRQIALQSDLFLKNESLIDPIFSNLSLDDKGSVLFDLEFLVDADFVDYKQMLQADVVPSTAEALQNIIGLSITGFVVFVSPTMGEISTLKGQVLSYDKALDNSKSLDVEREKLTKKYNSIDPNNLAKLEKLLPDNVDNIRLILEVEKLASPYGMVLRDVKYDTIKKTEEDKQPTEVFQGSDTNTPAQTDYGTWDLEFSTEGSYTNFLNLLTEK